MKIRFTVLFLILLFFSVFTPKAETKAQETDYVATAVAALQTSSVYVYPNTPGTDYNTEVNLKKFLTDGDQIVLIILPSEALSGTDIRAIAQEISIELNNQKTIGLAVGNEVYGYSLVLPEGVSEDKMHRASTVSNDPITALITFTQNIHTWQANNPQPTPTPLPEPTATPRPTMEPIDVPETSEVPSSVWIIFIIFFAIFTAFLATSIKKARDKQKLDSIKSQINREDY